jgi:PKD repeat protein
MKHVFRMLLVALICVATSFLSTAQVSGYTFAQSTTTYSSITGTALFPTNWDDNVQNLTLPFSFQFNGASYSAINVSSNGFITFGTTAPTTTGYTPISGTTAYSGAISAFGRDIIVSSAAETCTYTTLGTAPNRTFVVQWNNARRYTGNGGLAGDVLNFQIRLSETTNVASVVYGTCSATSTTSLTCQVGLRGSSNTNFLNRTSTTSWSATTNGGSNTAAITTLNTILPASGLTFSWTPVICSGTPVTPTLANASVSVCANSVATVSATVSSAIGVTHQWQESPNGTTSWASVTNGTGGTTTSYTTTAITATRYFRIASTCSASGLTSFSSVATVSSYNCNTGNDICTTATAVVINGGPINVNNAGTTTNGPNPGCGGGTMIADLWYSFIYQGGTITIQTALGTLNDTRLAVYSACGSAVPLACNDDFGGTYASQIVLDCSNLMLNSTYYIQAGGYNGATGAFTLDVTSANSAGCTNPNATNYNACAATDNGSCVFPELIADFNYVPIGTDCLNIQFSNASQGNVVSWTWTINGGTPSSSTVAAPSVSFPAAGVYSVTLNVVDSFGATASSTQNVIVQTGGIMTVDITADNLPQQISWKVFDIADNVVAQGTSNDATFCIADNCHRFEIYDSGSNGLCCGNGTGGYVLYLDGIQVASGSTFTSLDTRDVNCPEGTSCNNAIVVGEGVFTAPAPNTWYSFTPTQNGQYRITTCGNNICDTKLWIYDYCNMALFDDTNEAAVTYNDDSNCGIQAEMTPFLTAGTTYYLRVGDTEGACGVSSIDFVLEYMGPIVGCVDVLACNYNPLAGAPGTCYYNGDPNCSNLGPDLDVSLNDLFTSMYVTTINGTDACLVNEGCLQGLGSRQIIRFTTRIANIGTQDYFIGVPNANNPQFEYDLCHNHYHYEGYAEYLLYDQNNQPMPQIGFKNGFCVLDLSCPSGLVAKYTCGNMGITAGCADIYSSGLSCQWIDVTDVPAGSYTLVVRTNWDQSPDAAGRYELRYDNNWAQVCISFGRDANGNIINFTKNINACPIIEDCLGVAFGNDYADCAGNCPGIVKRADVVSDNLLNETDVHQYLDAGVDNAVIAVSTCTDLNNDGEISVADATLLEECIHTQLDLGVLPMLVDECAWDSEVFDAGESVEIGISSVNLASNYFDIYINNPLSEISGLEFEISGAVISNVQNLLNVADWNPHIHFETDGHRINAAGAVHSRMPVHFADTPVLRVYYSSLEGSEICVSSITDILNAFIHNVVAVVGDCQAASSITASFTASQSNVCSGSQVTFSDTSTGAPTTWSWTMPGATPSTSSSQNPSVNYYTPGTYSVTLVASNSGTSNEVTYSAMITVSPSATWYLDADDDGYGISGVTISACTQPAGYVSQAGDCNNNNASVNPAATEICNGIDDNCAGGIDEGFDADNDGYTTCGGDCDDNSAIRYPGAAELCNNQDEDCDTIIDEGFDVDNDGYTVCEGDCNDNNAAVRPGATEVCNSIDDDCDASIDEGVQSTFYRDLDGDTYGNAAQTIQACSAPAGYVSNSTDCNDASASVYPGASEVCGNGIDDDCANGDLVCPIPGCMNSTACNYNAAATVDNGTCTFAVTYYLDADADGFAVSTTSSCSNPGAGYTTTVLPLTDCNDASFAVKPSATELCSNTIDDDCDGLINEGCTINYAANDNQANATVVVPANYPSCTNRTGNLALASAEDGGNADLWYTFTATTNAIRISVTGTTATNTDIQVLDNFGNQIGSIEDASSANGNEIFMSDDLVIGQVYDIAVGNAGGFAGTFTVCIQALRPSGCGNGPTFEKLCNTFKATWTGTTSYTVVLQSVSNPGNFYVQTTANSAQMPFTGFTPLPGNTLSGGVQYGQSYSASVSANYTLTDAGGNVEVYVAQPAQSTCVISINAQPAVNLGAAFVSSAFGVNTRSLNTNVSTDISVCGIQNYTWEFVAVDPLTNQIITSELPRYWTGATTTRNLKLSNANISGIAAGKRYRVRVRPNFAYGNGSFDLNSTLYLQITGSAGMTVNEGEVDHTVLLQERNEDVMSIEDFGSMLIYPNPSNGSFINLNLEGIDESNIMIDIIDSQGRKVYSQSNVITTDGFVRIEFENQLAAGLYTVLVSMSNEILTEKVVVKN